MNAPYDKSISNKCKCLYLKQDLDDTKAESEGFYKDFKTIAWSVLI